MSDWLVVGITGFLGGFFVYIVCRFAYVAFKI
jgi:hypothetical protein